MAYTVFTASTTAFAEEVMNNFYFVYQGDRLPYNNSFSATSNTYNIGGSSYRWKKIYANLLEVSAVTTSSDFMNSVYNTSTSDATTTAIDISLDDTGKNYGFYCYAEFSGNMTTTINFINMTFNSITTATYTSSYSSIRSDYSVEHTTGGIDIGIPLHLVSSATSESTSVLYIRMNGRVSLYEGEEPQFSAEAVCYGLSGSAFIGTIYSRFISGFLNDTSSITTINMQFDTTINNHKIAVWRLD